MKIPLGALSFLLLTLCLGSAQPFGLTNRVANTTLRMPTTIPTATYRVTNAFGSLTFSDPVAIVTPPGETNRIFIVEQVGRIIVLTNLANPTRTVFMDIVARVRSTGEQGLLGLAFHPGYTTNRYFFVFYTSNTNGNQTGSGDITRHDRLSRFEISSTDTNAGLPNSEVILINQRDEASNHNGGCLQFGPDGYLYVSLGDEGGANDQFNNSQVIDKDFFAGMIRLDVDNRPESLMPNPHPANTNNPLSTINYRIPADNPYIGATSFNGLPVNPANVRTEFYAVGLRNPWRYSFDPVTGLLYLADVGQGAREEVDIIYKGGNYGWAYREGLIAGPKTPPGGFTSVQPIQDYGRGNGTNQGASVTGGVVYRGSKIPHLYGAYIFADYISSNIWQMRYEVNNGVTNITPFSWLMRESEIACFGVDPSNGDVLMGDLNDIVQRLIYVPPLPPTLADTGAFTNLTTLTPNPGIIPYDVNTPYWTDGANKTRWFSIPDPLLRMTFRGTQSWTFPLGTVWIQHFDLEMTNGVPASKRRLETRFLVRDTSASPSFYGVTYRWNSPSNAVLVPNQGEEETFEINDGGTLRSQTWRYPGRAECLACHTVQAGRALGFNTPQLNRTFDYNGVVDNQIRSLNNANYFSPPGVSNLYTLPVMASLDNESFSAQHRMRSYMMANCSHCHSPGGAGQANFNARIYTPLSQQGIVDGSLLNNLGNPSNRVVYPGSLANSIAYARLGSDDITFRMPPIGRTLVDQQALNVFRRWIEDELPVNPTFAWWQVANFGATNAPNAGPTADPDGDRANNQLEYLTGTDPNNAADVWSIQIQRSGTGGVSIVYTQAPNHGFEVHWTTNLPNPLAWRVLNIPENRPNHAPTESVRSVPDVIEPHPMKTYRVRVYEP